MRNGPYEMVVAPSDYPGRLYRGRYCYEHHLVLWRATGAIVRPGEVVHHRNHNKRDNRPDNLELMRSGAHTATHHRIAWIARPCAYCGKLKHLQPGKFRAKVRSGQRDFFCGHSCQAKKQRPRLSPVA